MRISIGLHETDVGLNHGAFVSNPESLSIFESFQRPFLERLSISKLHVFLVIIGGILSSLLVVIGNEGHLLRVVSIDEFQLVALE